MARRTGKKVRTGIAKVSLTIAAALTLLSMTGLPAYAWSSSLATCVGNYTSSTYPTTCTTNPTITIPTTPTVYDTAKLTLTSNGPPYGTVSFSYASGTCASHGTPSAVGTAKTVTASGTTYYTASLATSSLGAGSYVWLVSYSGTTSGYPAISNDCEPFTIVVTQQHGVPEFPIGLPILMALALPAMLLLRRSMPKA